MLQHQQDDAGERGARQHQVEPGVLVEPHRVARAVRAVVEAVLADAGAEVDVRQLVDEAVLVVLQDEAVETRLSTQ